MKLQWSFKRDGKRLILGRMFGWGWQCEWCWKVSLSLCWKLQDAWAGVYVQRESFHDWTAYVCLLPCLPIRIGYRRSYGGIFPELVNTPGADRFCDFIAGK